MQGGESDTAERHRYVVFVGEVEETWDRKDVEAAKMMEKAGVPPKDTKDHILEALDGKNGNPVAEFRFDQIVDLSLPDRVYFRIAAGGGGFS